jgi:hypothetical protein
MTDDIWESVLEPYAEDDRAAFILAQTFHYLKETLNNDPKGKALLSHALDLGIEKLFQYTEHHKAGFQLYLIALAGNLKPKHDVTEIARE